MKLTFFCFTSVTQITHVPRSCCLSGTLKKWWSTSRMNNGLSGHKMEELRIMVLENMGISGRSSSSQTGWPTISSLKASSEWVFMAMYETSLWHRRHQERRCFGSFPWEQTRVCRSPTWPFKGAPCKYMLKRIFTNIFSTQIGVTAALINSNLRLGSLTHCITVGRCKVLYNQNT